MEIKYGTQFRKQFKKANKEVKTAFADALELFIEDPKHSSLRNHALRNKFSGHRSIDVTEDWRALYREEPERIVFIDLGTHKQLYG